MITNKIIIFLTILFPLIGHSQKDTSASIILKNKIKIEIEKLDSCGLNYITSLPAAVWDSMGRIIGKTRYISIKNDSLISILERQSIEFLNKVLIEMLSDSVNSKYAWSANVLLFYVNKTYGRSLIRYENCKGSLWFREKRTEDLNNWRLYLERTERK